MPNKLLFDTLEYAKMLEKGNVKYSEIHSASLAYALSQNIYTKDEIKNMIEAILEKMDRNIAEIREETRAIEKRTHEMRLEGERRTQVLRHEMQLEFKEFSNRIDQITNQAIYKTVGILGTLIVVVGAISTFAHYFIS